MAGDVSTQDLEQSRELLDELLQEVKSEEGALAGGEKLGRGGGALAALRESDVSFGNPYDRLVQLTPDLFATVGVELDPIQRQQLEGNFDFYYMTITVSLFPKRGAQFQLVECRLAFPDEEAIIQNIFPEARWRKVLEYGGSLSLALQGDLEWQAGIPGDKIAQFTNIEGVPSAHIKNQNEMSSYVVVPDYSFDIGRPEITAVGIGDARASWRLQNPELKEGQVVRFALVFKVPAGTKQVALVGKVVAEPKMSWLTAQISDVFDELSDRFRRIFSKSDAERQGAERLPVGAHEKWTLQLPRG
jgi:hypothetical protein